MESKSLFWRQLAASLARRRSSLKLIDGNPNAPKSENHREVMLQEACSHPKIRIDEHVGIYCPMCKAHFTIEFDQAEGSMTFWIGDPDDVHDDA